MNDGSTGGGPGTESSTGSARASGGYRGLFGAFPYAVRHSRSRVFALYAVIGGLLALAICALFALALVVLLAETVETEGTLSLLRSFFVLVALLIVLPIVAPVLFVARRHRRTGSDPTYDRRLALAGFGFVASVYVALLISTPPDQQAALEGPLAVVVEPLYALPAVLGLVPPVLTAALIYAVHRASA